MTVKVASRFKQARSDLTTVLRWHYASHYLWVIFACKVIAARRFVKAVDLHRAADFDGMRPIAAQEKVGL